MSVASFYNGGQTQTEQMVKGRHFLWAKGMQPLKINNELRAVCGTGVMIAQHVRKKCCEFANGRISILDEQKIG